MKEFFQFSIISSNKFSYKILVLL